MSGMGVRPVALFGKMALRILITGMASVAAS
eukprot:CAMPEP_0175437542 /NCGR_PEP_ID=MMETSP0095-20121207/55531_1 /TAXON_ID=311494 /ORGANISM="Alexandrium monilatum, Strain CCMP3105" /LENGTH=30 /DNA_ID= /DNA_START= /DNA_END= /DNA_ORIENTATION=